MEPNSNPARDSEIPLPAETQAQGTFEKLKLATQLIKEGICEVRRGKSAKLAGVLLSLEAELGILCELLSKDDTQLDLDGLVAKYEWRVGQCFYVRAVVQSADCKSFAVLPRQDIPEGVKIHVKRANWNIRMGEHVSVDLQLSRRGGGLAWSVRSIDRD
jgi:hypothetical protein